MVAAHAGLANTPEGCIQVGKLVQAIVHHRRTRGNLVGQSVFAWKKCILEGEENENMCNTHLFAAQHKLSINQSKNRNTLKKRAKTVPVDEATVARKDVQSEGFLVLLDVLNDRVYVLVLQHRQQGAKNLLRHHLGVHGHI